MAYGEGQLSGSADYRVGLDIYMVSQSAPANASTFWWGVYLQNPNGQGAWINDAQSWAANLAEGWAPRSGTWNRPSNKAGIVQELLASGYIDVGHDGAGYRPGFWNDASISCSHAAIGSGSVRVWVDAPRIPKTPSPIPAAPTLSQVTANSMRVSWSAPTDNGGATINAYLVRVHTNPNVEAAGYSDYAVGGSVLSLDLTGLAPATTYYVAVYPRNSVGYGHKSTTASAQTLAGIYVSDGANWVAAPLRVSDGSAWQTVMPKISDGTAWKDPLNV